ncbi:MAG TPA: DUF4230 domain-containing protein [Blastocatellia bacterium]|nr:DUF4230 domain-containing protein [Blastocatellia bacterium]
MKFANQKTAAQRLWPWVAGLALAGVLLSFAIWFVAARLYSFTSNANRSQVTQSVIVERVEKVAKLVSSQTTLRDVVVYENTWYGSTKKALVVVTGKIMAGIDLDRGSDVQINDQLHQITISLPRPEVLAVEITDVQTYDEQRGWWNPFTSADHDAIYKLARDKFAESGNELKIADTAQQSATELLQNMFATDGYRVVVTYR